MGDHYRCNPSLSGSNVKPINFAVFLDQNLHDGGGYQQALNAIQITRQLPPEICTLIFITTILDNIEVLQNYGIEAHFLKISPWRRALLKVRSSIYWLPMLRLLRRWIGENIFESYLSKNKIDLVYFTSPSWLAMCLERVNYIYTVWDLAHRDDPEFPEVRNDREFERRDVLYSRTLSKAVAVLVDSDDGKRNVIHRYGVDNGRIYLMPFSPASGTQLSEDQYRLYFVDIKSKYELNIDYIFYPAQFWPHKNHAYLLRGLKALEDIHGIKVGAIFSGGDAGGNLTHVKKVADDLGLSDRIRFAGFVSNQEIPYLYRQAIALVMPTYFGPTNLPPLEAFSLGVPVLYPDKSGLREQVGDAALLMDLCNAESMAQQLVSLLSSEKLRNDLVANGKDRLHLVTDADRVSTLTSILNDYRARISSWK